MDRVKLLVALSFIVAAMPAPVVVWGAAPDSALSDTTVTTIFLVRHAEKNVAFAGEDPPLSEAGIRRAQALAHTLRDAGITAIYSTRFRRCRDTAMPLATYLGDTLRIVDQGDFAGFARRVISENPGGTVLIVGHGDTVPQIVEQLVGHPLPPWVAGDHDLIYAVSIHSGGRAHLFKLRYGDESL